MSLLHLYPYNHAHWVASHEIGSIRPLSFYKNGSFKCFSSLPIPNLYLHLSITRTHPKLTKTPLILNLGGQESGCSGMEREQGLGDLGVKEAQGWLPSCPGL